ncbi:MAG TPA: thiamine-phosphate kinase [Vicinamibacterales bacterium]|nr:thiamine-phosphate kinase [Vicinamibacterales bacterium]
MSSGPTVAELGEHALIARLRSRITNLPDYVELGIGDDAAAIAPPRSELDIVTTDALVEGVHFRRDWTAADAIGHKALAVNLSDLAAMGATPRAALLSLALPETLLVAEFDALLDGFLALATATATPLVGGNITRSPGPLMIDVTAIGSAPRRKLLRRSGGAAGDELYVTGALGGAAAGLLIRQTGDQDGDPECLRRYERPTPQLRAGRLVARSRTARAAIDLSDGLADGARQLAAAAGLGVEIDAEAVPILPAAAAIAASAGRDALELALAGGEDYELLFVVGRRQRRGFLATVGRASVAATLVGRLVDDPGAILLHSGMRKPLPDGFSHF